MLPGVSVTRPRTTATTTAAATTKTKQRPAAEPTYDFAYVHEAWKAREAVAAVDEVRDERGEPMIIELHTPICGEIEAGFEWADDFHQVKAGRRLLSAARVR